VQAVEKARRQFGEKILIEGGISMINELIDHGVIDQLELSVTPASGGDERINWKGLLTKFTHRTSHEIAGTTFYSAHN
jgi:riboflavin biosynthesis pyrimidine reductase